MSEKFDPYHTWLGISPHEQPPHFYRLLGIGLFESDPAVIAGAADRQMAYVRTFQAGPRGAFTQKLLNEIAAARVCLLNPAERRAYDDWLRAWLAAGAGQVIARPLPPATPTAVAPPPVSPPPVSSPPVADLPRGRLAPGEEPRPESAPATNAWLWALAGIVGLFSISAIVALIVVIVNRRPEPAPSGPPAEPAQPPPAVATTPPEPEPAAPQTVVTEQEGNGDVELVASAAQREGEATLIEQGSSSAIEGLHGATDRLRWEFRLAKPGFFRVAVHYVAGAESAGGRFRISVGEKKVEGTVRDSAGQVSREVVGILLVQKSGRHTLEFAPVSVSGRKLFQLHSIRLMLRP